MLRVKTTAPLRRTAAIPRDSEVPSSSSNENSLVRIRKTIYRELLLENQQAKIFPFSSLFTAIGNNPQDRRAEGQADDCRGCAAMVRTDEHTDLAPSAISLVWGSIGTKVTDTTVTVPRSLPLADACGSLSPICSYFHSGGKYERISKAQGDAVGQQLVSWLSNCPASGFGGERRPECAAVAVAQLLLLPCWAFGASSRGESNSWHRLTQTSDQLEQAVPTLVISFSFVVFPSARLFKVRRATFLRSALSPLTRAPERQPGRLVHRLVAAHRSENKRDKNTNTFVSLLVDVFLGLSLCEKRIRKSSDGLAGIKG
ncbi:hypothetical protein H920_01029 [Fukomys damarensis]|uniref:Uncharacterized protein n=1 Tax=Fukomys damarensis TaxID=885580 RepID=A0A091DZI9_FUKDA|nr:hypothetical protein H920_01029 [Fukomys damarensis]